MCISHTHEWDMPLMWIRRVADNTAGHANPSIRSNRWNVGDMTDQYARHDTSMRVAWIMCQIWPVHTWHDVTWYFRMCDIRCVDWDLWMCDMSQFMCGREQTHLIRPQIKWTYITLVDATINLYLNTTHTHSIVVGSDLYVCEWVCECVTVFENCEIED